MILSTDKPYRDHSDDDWRLLTGRVFDDVRDAMLKEEQEPEETFMLFSEHEGEDKLYIVGGHQPGATRATKLTMLKHMLATNADFKAYIVIAEAWLTSVSDVGRRKDRQEALVVTCVTRAGYKYMLTGTIKRSGKNRIIAVGKDDSVQVAGGPLSDLFSGAHG